MNRQEIDALVKQMNVDTATGPVDERVQQVVVRLLGDLFQAIRRSWYFRVRTVERSGILYGCRPSRTN